MITLLHGDCLELMKTIPDKSIDLVLTDPPYGTTACKWDSVIPFEPMWKELKRIRRGAIILFAGEPFLSALIMSNVKEFNHCLVWDKKEHSNNLAAKKQHLKTHEMIALFYKKQPPYFPQGLVEKNIYRPNNFNHKPTTKINIKKPYTQTHTGYPKDILKFQRPRDKFHPTQKPVALLEYLIKTYTLEGETVLDFTMGSGSTGVACKNLNRKFIGLEKDDNFFQIAQQRIYG
jgi:DNA modification methylase